MEQIGQLAYLLLLPRARGRDEKRERCSIWNIKAVARVVLLLLCRQICSIWNIG